MDIEWLLLLCIPVVKVPYIYNCQATYSIPKTNGNLPQRAHQQEMFFLAPFLDGAYSEY